jgi:hypothetical protein
MLAERTGSILREGREALQTLWLKSRVREVVWDILGGSIAGTLFPAGRTWIATSFKQILGDVSEDVPNFRGPAIAAVLAILALVLPRFLRKTVCPFRSWKGGLVRGTSLIWLIGGQIVAAVAAAKLRRSYRIPKL